MQQDREHAHAGRRVQLVRPVSGETLGRSDSASPRWSPANPASASSPHSGQTGAIPADAGPGI
jgi:hypothetical protein